MRAAAIAWWRAVRHLNHRGYVYIWANVLWVALSLPLITAPAAWAGLARLSYLSSRQPGVTLDEFWQGFRENLKRGAALAIINVLVIVVNVVNLLGFRNAGGLAFDGLRVFWLLVVIIWFGIQLYVWPLFYAMERPSLPGAFKNAALMVILNPLFTLTAWFIAAVVIVVSTLLPAAWILLTGALLAAAANGLVADRLQAAGFSADVLPDYEPEEGLPEP